MEFDSTLHTKMAYTDEQRLEYKAVIRHILIFNPMATCRMIKTRLAKSEKPLDLSLEYILGLMKDIRADRRIEIEEETKEELYSHIRDTVDFVNQQLRAIAQEEKLVYSKTKDGLPTESPEVRIYAQNNRIKAINSIIDNIIKLANLKMDLGIIERKIGTVDHDIIDVMSALKNIRNGNYTTPIKKLILAPHIAEVRDGASVQA